MLGAAAAEPEVIPHPIDWAYHPFRRASYHQDQKQENHSTPDYRALNYEGHINLP
jgi:hypothetical protein